MKSSLATAVCLVAAGCAAFRPVNPHPPRYGAYFVLDSSADASTDSIDIKGTAMPDRIAISLQNRSDRSVRLLWNEVAFVDPDQRSLRVMHVGVLFVDCARVVPPALIPSGSRLEDEAVPCDNTHLSGATRISSLLPPTYFGSSDSISILGQLRSKVGKEARLVIPMSVGDQRVERTLVFKVREVAVRRAGTF